MGIIGLFAIPALLIALAVLALVVAALVDPGPWLARLVEIACWAAIAVAAISGLVSVGNSLIGNSTTVQVPIAVHTPEVRVPGVELVKPEAVIVSGGVDRATLTIQGLSWEPRILLGLETALQVVTVVFFALVIRRLAHNVRAGAPFDRLSQPLVRAAAVLFVSSFLWTILGSVGSYMAGREALAIQGWSGPDSVLGGLPLDSAEALSYLGWPEPGSFSINFSFLPFIAAFVLGLLGLAFRAGERMQADTKGLI